MTFQDICFKKHQPIVQYFMPFFSIRWKNNKKYNLVKINSQFTINSTNADTVFPTPLVATRV